MNADFPQSASRLTCFALLSGVEQDLRALVADVYAEDELVRILPADVVQAATVRCQRDQPELTTAPSPSELLHYSDLADIGKVIAAGAKAMPRLEADVSKLIVHSVQVLAGPRNRVCHARPLEPEDLPVVLDVARSLSSHAQLATPQLDHALSRLAAEPAWVLHLQIPSYWRDTHQRVSHNLPVPEFDDTGFIGRVADRRAVRELILSHHPVVTIIGEGGIGKTALALRCLYDLLDTPDLRFDVVVWVTLKTSRLTVSGVQDIRNKISSTLGLLASIASGLGAPAAESLTEPELVQEILDYVREYRILLVIDNLETVDPGPLRTLMLGLNEKSKLLITSRIGLREFEVRYRLDSMDRKTATALMRLTTRSLGQTPLTRSPDAELATYCSKLFDNPLLIKWFVSGVANGASPARLTGTNFADLAGALSFCLDSLLESLTESEMLLVRTLLYARRPVSVAEAHYLHDSSAPMTAEQLALALSRLETASIARRSQDAGGGYVYQLTAPAMAYIPRRLNADRASFQRVQAKLTQIARLGEADNELQASYKYEIFSIRTASRDERIAATHLRLALKALDEGKVDAARAFASEAQDVLPGWSEALRVAALVESRSGDMFRASELFEGAIECDPRSAICRYAYAQYLMKELSNNELALKHLQIAQDLDRNDPSILTLKASALTRLGRLLEASEIYSELLKAIEGRSRRWRLSTCDQAAECYRRIAVRCLREREYDACANNVRTAVAVLRESVARDDYDARSIVRLGRVLTLGFWCALQQRSAELADHLVCAMREILLSAPGAKVHLQCAREQVLELLGDRADAGAARTWLEECAIQIAWNSRGSRAPGTKMSLELIAGGGDGTNLRGRVKTVAEGGRFGFITDETGCDWFFHANGLRSAGMDGMPEVGALVEFKVGVNQHGKCAIDVYPSE